MHKGDCGEFRSPHHVSRVSVTRAPPRAHAYMHARARISPVQSGFRANSTYLLARSAPRIKAAGNPFTDPLEKQEIIR